MITVRDLEDMRGRGSRPRNRLGQSSVRQPRQGKLALHTRQGGRVDCPGRQTPPFLQRRGDGSNALIGQGYIVGRKVAGHLHRWRAGRQDRQRPRAILAQMQQQAGNVVAGQAFAGHHGVERHAIALLQQIVEEGAGEDVTVRLISQRQ